MNRVLQTVWWLGIMVLLSGQVSFAQTNATTAKTNAAEQAQFDKLVTLIKAAQFAEAIPVAKEWIKCLEVNYGPTHTNTVDALYNLATIYQKVSDYTNAAAICQRALEIREKVLGPEDPSTAVSLDTLAAVYFTMGDYPKVEPLLARSLRINEKVSGPEHPRTAAALNNLAEFYTGVGDYTKAVLVLERSLRIYEKALGAESSDTATSINNLASLYRKAGDYVKAEPLYQRCLKIREKLLGPEHPDTATSIANLGVLYLGMGDYSKAQPLLDQSLNIREKVLGPDHLDTATSLDNLAEFYRQKVEYAKAEPLYRRSMEIYEKILGSEHPAVAMSLNNLAILYQSANAFEIAEPLYQRSLAIYENSVGAEHLDTAMSLNNLAELYRMMGDYAKARPLYKRSLKIRENVLGPEHPDTAMSLNNLALLYLAMEDFKKAGPLFEKSLRVYEKNVGKEHPDTAKVLNNLALLYSSTGDYAKAQPMYQRSLKIYEKILGSDHPDTAKALNNLALLCHKLGDDVKAERLFEQGLNSYEKVWGADHLDTAMTLVNLAVVKIDLGKLDEARSLGRKCKASSEGTLGQLLSFTSDRQRMSFRDNATLPLADLLATLGATVDLAEFTLRTKGMVLDSLLEDEAAARASTNTVVKEALAELREAGRRMTRLEMEQSGNPDPESVKKRRAEKLQTEEQVEILQKSLAQHVTSVGQARRALSVTVPDIQAALAQDTVLLDFIQYSHYLGKDRFEPRYGVLIIGNPKVGFQTAKVGEPVWVPLVSSKTLEQNLQEYGAVMRGDKRGGPELLRTLYTQLFEPIQTRLPKGVTTLIISPDAELNFLSFATLVDQQEKFLAERYSIKYVASGRDLLFGKANQPVSPILAAFANPSFGKRPAQIRNTNTVQLAMQNSDRRDYGEMTLGALPNTSLEAQFLKERSSAWHLGGSVYVGAEATEAEVKAVKSPHILHLATHGFFLSDAQPTNRLVINAGLLGERMPVVFHNPMQRSGLAFAGAQLTLDAWKRGEIPDTDNDGILMAQEVGTMDLKNTWLVVLSACDTGIGEARNGEGVMGLRRGFVQAGAQNLLMTLWPISDRFSVDIMKQFYERAMVSHDAAQAMADVQREWLARLRKEKGVLIAARLAGPFVLSTRGRQPTK